MDTLLLRRRMMMQKAQGGGRLPEYQEVEYLQSDGNQIIKVANVTFAGKRKIYLDAKCLYSAGMNSVITCSYTSPGFYDGMGIGKYEGRWTMQENVTSAFSAMERTMVELIITDYGGAQSAELTVNSQTITASRSSRAPYTDITMFPQVSCVIWSCSIYDNGILIFYFIPCYRISDNKTGMYDIVNERFYPNEGTGEFIVGPNIG